MENGELRKQWELRIASFRSSGQTLAKWCKKNHLKPHQLKSWLKKIEGIASQANPAALFTPLFIEELTQPAEATLQVKIAIEVKPVFDSSLFADVIKVLKTVC